jgi:hypothetical protein
MGNGDARSDARDDRRKAQKDRKDAANSLDASAQWRGFIDYKLSEEEKLRFEAWQEPITAEEVFAYIESVTQIGKVSVSYMGSQRTWLASLTAQRGNSYRKLGYTLTARAGNMVRAILALWFKDVVVAERAWTIQKHDEPIDQTMVE